MKKRFSGIIFRLLLFMMIVPLQAAGQDFPERPEPPRLVNDFAGMLTIQEANALERKLVAYNDSTSTQIAIVTVKDLHGYDKSDYAQRLAEKWGIGQKGKNNGILILVKPKTVESRGEVFIAPGYGLEGVVPDIVCSRIVDNEIIPDFRMEEYYRGLDRATSTLMALASGEYPPDQYNKQKQGNLSGLPVFIIFLIIFIIAMFMRGGGGSNSRNIGHKGLPLWLLLSMMNSGRNSHNGSWGRFSGGGGFGGGGGGFGGFGGGSFGGGGAGGSW